MRHYWFLFLFSLIGCPALAQLNESDTAKVQVRISATGNRQWGNVELLVTRIKADLVFALPHNWVFKSQNSFLYQEFGNNKADEDVFSRNYFYYQPQRKVYPYFISYISTNFRRKINHRHFLGAGLTYQAIRSPQSVLKISSNVIYESSSFAGQTYNFSEYNGSDTIDLWRLSLYLYAHHRIGKMKTYVDAFWQPHVNGNNNFRSQIEAGIDVPAWKGLNFNMLYTFTHENVVVTGIRQNDSLLSFGLSYQFIKS